MSQNIEILKSKMYYDSICRLGSHLVFQIMTSRQQKERSCEAQKMFKVQQPKTKKKQSNEE